MDQVSPRTIKNMYKYVAERMKERLSNLSIVLLDSLNKAEIFKSVVQEISDQIGTLVEGIEEDFKIIRKIEKEIERRQ